MSSARLVVRLRYELPQTRANELAGFKDQRAPERCAVENVFPVFVQALHNIVQGLLQRELQLVCHASAQAPRNNARTV